MVDYDQEDALASRDLCQVLGQNRKGVSKTRRQPWFSTDQLLLGVCKTGIEVIPPLQISKMKRMNLKRTSIIGRGCPRSWAPNSKQNPQSTIDYATSADPTAPLKSLGP